jgi:CBS domain-containing protein
MKSPSENVREIMVREVKTIGRNDVLSIADEVMQMGRIRHLPVLEGGEVVGVVSQRDLFRSALASALGFGERAQTAVMRTVVVKEIMSTPAIMVAPGATLREAGRLLLEHRIGCLPVVEEGKLVGLVTETDLLRATLGL